MGYATLMVGQSNSDCALRVADVDGVTIYGLFNEHFQGYQTLWYGESGRLYFYQCETPYDPQAQADYLSHVSQADGQQSEGYAAYKVARGVKHHYASMLGIYDVFIYTNNAAINIRNSIEIPKGEADVRLHNACNVCISNLPKCGFQYVVGDVCKSTYFANQGAANGAVAKRYQVVDFNGTQVQMPDWKVDEVAPGKEDTGVVTIVTGTDAADAVRVYPNPCSDHISIDTPSTDYTVALLNAQGAQVAGGHNVRNIGTAGLANGLHLVQVAEKNGNHIVKKVIKN